MDGVLNLLGDRYKARFPGPLAAYNRLQTALMRHFVYRGGTVERWMTDLAPAFRHRYGWLCRQPVPALYWKVTGRQQLGSITLPSGFSIAIYSGAVPNARQMALGDNGTVFVGPMRKGNVYALVDSEGDNVAEETYTIASDLTLPSGVAFQDGALYVAAVSRILV